MVPVNFEDFVSCYTLCNDSRRSHCLSPEYGVEYASKIFYHGVGLFCQFLFVYPIYYFKIHIMEDELPLPNRNVARLSKGKVIKLELLCHWY